MRPPRECKNLEFARHEIHTHCGTSWVLDRRDDQSVGLSAVAGHELQACDILQDFCQPRVQLVIRDLNGEPQRQFFTTYQAAGLSAMRTDI